jgi:hypothetical protein
MDRQTDGQMDGQMDRQTDRRMNSSEAYRQWKDKKSSIQSYRQADSEMERRVDRRTDTGIERPRAIRPDNTHTSRFTERQNEYSQKDGQAK